MRSKKLYNHKCTVCGKPFKHSSPSKLKCEDEETHKKIRYENKQRKQVMSMWGSIPNKPRKESDWYGSWDNAVKVVEGD